MNILRTKCIYCKKSFRKTKNSKEHLIPEGIGGKLTKRFLLCKICNEVLSKYDKALQEHLAIFLSLKKIKGKRKLISAKGESKYGILEFINGKPIVKGKVINNPNGTRAIQGDKKYTTKILEGLKKKNPKTKVINRSKMQLDTILLKPINQNIWKGVGKILYLFAHYFDEDYIPKTDFFKNFLSQPENSIPFDCPIGWVGNDIEKFLDLPKELKEHPCDCILVVIDYRNKEKCIIGYISFFGIKYIGLIDDKYEGNTKVIGYFINIKNKISNEFSSNNALNINRKTLSELLDNWLTKDTLSQFIEQYSQAFIDAIFSRSIEDSFFSAAEKAGLSEGDRLNKKWLENFVKELMESNYMKNLLPRKDKPDNEKISKD